MERVYFSIGRLKLQNNVFNFLIAGLVNYYQTQGKYPFPPLLTYSLNQLALHMVGRFPRTLHSLFELFQRPLNQWWPTILPLPPEFDQSFGLVYQEHLSEEAASYYYEWVEKTELKSEAPPGVFIAAAQNLELRKIITELLRLYQDVPLTKEKAQAEYCQIRQFLIRYPYATRRDFHRELSNLSQDRLKQMRLMYDEVLPQAAYWNCDNCGPLQVENGQLRGIKPSVCNDHWWEAPHIHEVEVAENLLVLNFGIHVRTHIPGLSELKLYDWLVEQQQQYPNILTGVHLWPGIDRYDLGLDFGGERWSVDVKDHKDPYHLGCQITTIFNEGDLVYKQGYYVFPARRLEQYPDYGQIVETEARRRKVFVKVVSDEQFKQKMLARLSEAKPGR